ncbi:hypothetical protein [Iningainema tapete]|uniref:Antifreeze protein n=1 Tax=Iningainema tapete BLCC-T55 TaxID=2748662 RepID=A0A8J6XJ09_9CYAN|nr:hypothetical protein [Iningainema tapete]MBD2775373.1 hypothetical protein [Iningainema tapete BLCC-T55]
MKRLIASAAVVIPLAIASLPKQASAAQVIINPHFRSSPATVVTVARRVERRVWVPGHWERTRRGRIWIPGHYERR